MKTIIHSQIFIFLNKHLKVCNVQNVQGADGNVNKQEGKTQIGSHSQVTSFYVSQK